MIVRASVALAVLAAVALSCRSGAGGPKPLDPNADRASLEQRAREATAAITDARLTAAASDPADWITHGGSYAETRYSELAKIDAGNAGQLGLAWFYDTNTNRGLEATPIVIDGILYATASWSTVFAIDARTGRQIWHYDPQVPREKGSDACCDVVNRGVAVYEGRVYVGTIDGRLIALDAANGRPVWEVQTTDTTRPYTITGAPRVVKGKVIIGNGGAELGVRGYVSAYDAKTGALDWRFYTVPGDPAQPQESAALEKALPTWSKSVGKGPAWWTVGGGGTVWDSMAYDPALDLLYVGTGNGSPWSRYARSPGGGDNLYLSSILALRPETGALVWHYQETPGDNWDYTATQHILLTTLQIDGKPREVLLHAPKNGFFYVLDRATGALLSAENYVEVTWAKGIDKKTGRPIEAKGTDYRAKTVVVKPSPYGGHNWQPMSFNPSTGLVYIPAQEIPTAFLLDKRFEYRPGRWNTGIDFKLITEAPRELVKGHLLAWDPVAQKEVWRVDHKTAWNGGTLTTAGNLVFQGTADGRFVAYRADTGAKLWEAPAQTGVIAAPVTYEIDGEQYVSVMAGWGGAFALTGGDAAAAAGVRNVGRLLTFKLGATAQLPPLEPVERKLAAWPAGEKPATAATVKQGEGLFAVSCSICHGAGGVSGGVLPDLRYSPVTPDRAAFEQVVRGGVRTANGMPSFAKDLSEKDVADIRSYLLAKASEEAAKLAGAGGAGGAPAAGNP